MSMFKEKTVVVTGAASGLGFATAMRFLAEGARVIGVDIDELPGASFDLIQADVSLPEDWQRITQHCLDETGRVDTLVNNAGITVRASIEDTKFEDFQRVMSVNVNSVFLGSQTLLPVIARSGGGSIINISSITSIMGYENNAAYAASKGAIAALTKSIAVYCRRSRNRVRCNSVHPDGILTPMVFTRLPSGIDAHSFSTDIDPMNRLCPPDDVVAAILFLASDGAKSVNGIELRVDNGQTIMGESQVIEVPKYVA